MPGEPCWGLGGKDTAPGTSRLTHCLTSFTRRGADERKAKPVLITLLTALSRAFINLPLSYLAHLSGFAGEGKGVGTLWSHSEQIVFQVRWLPSFSFAKPFLFPHI